MSLAPERSLAALAVAARVGGTVLALGFLVGLVGGPLVAPLGGLALVTLGRALRIERGGQILAALGFAAIAGAVGVSALRWGTLDLAELRAVQAVLGPTLAVGPEQVAGAAIAAAVAAWVALVLWVGAPPPRGAAGWLGAACETLAAALALVTAFWGPKLLFDSPEIPTSEVVASAGAWAGAAAAVMLTAALGAWPVRRLGLRSRAGLAGMSLVTVAVAFGIVVSSA